MRPGRLEPQTAGMTTTPPAAPTTVAFHVQAVISFGVSLVAVGLAVAYLPADPWVRAFLALAVLYVVTSAFTLAKCVRDRQESAGVISRVDQARLDRLLAEHDPFKVDA
ncbi:YiaA/YiaB family inner membrane protein [Pseudonocardia xinjiangensis]